MSRARYTSPIETLSNIDTWLDDPGITELRRAELLAARDRVAAIRTAMIMNGMGKEEDDGSGDIGRPERTAGAKTGKATKRSRTERNNMGKSRGTRSA